MSKLSDLTTKLSDFLKVFRLYASDSTGSPTDAYILGSELINYSKQQLFDSLRIYQVGETVVIDNSGYKEYLCITLTVAGESPITTPGKWAMLGDALFRPTTEPVVSASVLTINMESNQNGIFEPRASTGTRTISSNFTLAFSNDSAADIIHATLQLTGTIIITMPATVDVVDSLPSFIAWDSGLDQLTVTAGTAEKIELDFLTDKSSGRKSLIVSNKLAV